MIHLNVEQDTPEWHDLRCGRVTASRVADVIRSGRSKAQPSASRQRYLGELVAERLTGTVVEGFKSADMQWGNDTEQDAADAYAFYRGVDLQKVSFVDHPKLHAGASPDRFAGDDGLVEIKCPATHTHIATLLGAPIDPDYIVQMHWQMACSGRQWCDFVSYDPRMPEEMRLHVVRINRDPTRIADLEAAVAEFLVNVDETLAALRGKFTARAAA